MVTAAQVVGALGFLQRIESMNYNSAVRNGNEVRAIEEETENHCLI